MYSFDSNHPGFLIIGSDTLHRRYLINTLLDRNVPLLGVIFENAQVKPSFHTTPVYVEKENHFLEKEFKKYTRLDLDRVNHWRFSNANSENALRKIDSLGPLLGVVSGAGYLKKEVVKKFQDGLLNIHLGIAEEYRGLDSNLWAAYHSDFKNIGVTVHYVDSGLDTGDIVNEERVKTLDQVEAYNLRFYEMLLATDMIYNELINYSQNSIKRRAQIKKGRYYSFMPSCLKTLTAKKLEKILN
jgi:folate-dependent phosphoribosylglycinamide formyltransferase PurN